MSIAYLLANKCININDNNCINNDNNYYNYSNNNNNNSESNNSIRNNNSNNNSINNRNTPIYINLSSQLINIAFQESYSIDGELFDITNVASLVTSIDTHQKLGLKASVQPIQEILSKEHIAKVYRIDDTLCVERVSSTMVIIPYDRDPMGNLPCLKNGNKAHYAVIIGYIDMSSNNDCIDSNNDEIYLIALQGKLIV
jgi:hypothetical protein